MIGRSDILSMIAEELAEFIQSLGAQSYRAGQLREWMYKGVKLEEMTNLPASFISKVKENAFYFPLEIERKLVSSIDGTVKYLFRLFDGQFIESVVMRYEYGLTICISSQVGCRMGCRFCASTIGGKVRDLAPSELLGQIIAASHDLGERMSHVVMMGIGEPLDNYDNVIRFLRLVNLKEGLGISYRNISISTCGLVDKIYKLSEENFPITLSISLHAPDDEDRSKIMPVNNKWHIEELLKACSSYFEKTGRRISFEYTLISGVNDSEAHAVKLTAVLKKYCGSMPLHVNLIPVNEISETSFKRSDRRSVNEFAEKLKRSGVNATVRRRLGSDINASCGQLRRSAEKSTDV